MVHPHARNPCCTLSYLNLMHAPQTQNSCITATHLKPDFQYGTPHVSFLHPHDQISCLTLIPSHPCLSPLTKFSLLILTLKIWTTWNLINNCIYNIPTRWIIYLRPFVPQSFGAKKIYLEKHANICLKKNEGLLANTSLASPPPSPYIH